MVLDEAFFTLFYLIFVYFVLFDFWFNSKFFIVFLDFIILNNAQRFKISSLHQFNLLDNAQNLIHLLINFIHHQHLHFPILNILLHSKNLHSLNHSFHLNHIPLNFYHFKIIPHCLFLTNFHNSVHHYIYLHFYELF